MIIFKKNEPQGTDADVLRTARHQSDDNGVCGKEGVKCGGFGGLRNVDEDG